MTNQSVSASAARLAVAAIAPATMAEFWLLVALVIAGPWYAVAGVVRLVVAGLA